MTFGSAALSSLAAGGDTPQGTDFRGGKNAKPLYELSRRCNDLVQIWEFFPKPRGSESTFDFCSARMIRLALPHPFIRVMAICAPVFSKPMWQHAKVLIIGVVLAPGKHTVTSMLQIRDPSDHAHFQTSHRVLKRPFGRLSKPAGSCSSCWLPCFSLGRSSLWGSRTPSNADAANPAPPGVPGIKDRSPAHTHASTHPTLRQGLAVEPIGIEI
jgi:hypothetical protein